MWVAPIEDKLWEARLGWYEELQQRPISYRSMMALAMVMDRR